MIILKNLTLILSLISFIIGIMSKNISLIELWYKYNVNSLIGFQKIIESLTLNKFFKIDIWHDILLNMLKIDIFIFFSILLFLFYISIFKAAKKAS